MASIESDVLVGWELDRHGRIVGFQGENAYHAFGATSRWLLPGLDTSFAEPRDVLVLVRASFLVRDEVGALANASRDRVLKASRLRAAFAIGLPAAAGIWLLIHLFPSGVLPLSPGVISLIIFGRLLDAGQTADRAVALFKEQRARETEALLARWRSLTAPPPPPPSPEEREARLAAAYAGSLEGVEWHELGPLPVEDGVLVADDGFELREDRGHDIAVPPGTHRVAVAVARLGPEQALWGEERIAYAALRLSDAPAARWERVIDAEGEDMHVGVDSATAGFASRESRRRLAVRFDAQQGASAELERVLDPVYEQGWTILEDEGARLVAFNSGFGDGYYPVYRALDAEGRPSAIVVDFKVY